MDAGNDLSDRINPRMTPNQRLAILNAIPLAQLFEPIVKEAAIRANEFIESEGRGHVDIAFWHQHTGQITQVLRFFNKTMKSLHLSPQIKEMLNKKLMSEYAVNNVISYDDH